MSVSPEIIEKIQKECIESLSGLVINTIASLERQVADQNGDTLMTHSDAIIDRFIEQMNYHFDNLMDREVVKKDAVFSFETLSLVQEEELDVMVALEGMVNASRNEHLPVFISFNTRLSSLFPRKRIDESTNPLDPEQVSTAFQEALRPIQIDAKHGLTIYRAFNKEVLKHMDDILNQGNRILIDSSVIPSLGMEGAQKQEKAKAARSQPRTETSSFGTLEEEVVNEDDDEESPELFSIMQNLLHFDEPADKPADEPPPQDVDVSDFDLDAALQAGGSVSRAPDKGGNEHGRFSSGGGAPGGGGTSGGGYPPGGGDFAEGSGGYQQGGDAPAGGFGPPPGGYPQGGGNYPQGGGSYPAGGGQSGMVPAQEVMIPASMIPGLLANSGVTVNNNPAGTAAAGAMQSVQLQEGQTVEMVDQVKLMAILTDIQSRLATAPPAAQGQVPSSIEEVDRIDISASLGEMLQSSNEDESVISAVDRQSSDIINLVTLLYEAIWQDLSVPIPIKELIGRTQVTIIKVALNDTNFFNDENHPARMILNEFASSGIGWTEVEALEQDPLYQKISELVDRLISYTDDISLFEELIADFQEFKAQETAKTQQLEQNILKAKERKERMDDIYELVSQKIEERILGRELDPHIDEMLHEHFHKFMVMLVIKEGPGSNAWKQAINTIDVLLWTVEHKEHKEDRERLDTVNPRLFNNLRKAFRIASVPPADIDEILTKLDAVQEASFPLELREVESAEDEAATTEDQEGAAEIADDETEAKGDTEAAEETEAPEADENEDSAPAIRFLAAGDDVDEPETNETAEESESEPAPIFSAADNDEDDDEAEVAVAEDVVEAPEPEVELSEDSPYVKQVDELSVGMWLEFAGDTEDNNTRCKLAAKINAIDKFIFVNRQGVKVLEKTKIGLAKELRDGTVSIISDGLLFSRALESVIGNLRDNQIEQHTSSAYQPDKEGDEDGDDEDGLAAESSDSVDTEESSPSLDIDLELAPAADSTAETEEPAAAEAESVSEDTPELSIDIDDILEGSSTDSDANVEAVAETDLDESVTDSDDDTLDDEDQK